MSERSTATFQVTNWDEKPYDAPDTGPKLTRATVTQTFQGDIEGDGAAEYLMMHREDGSATFVGQERIVGSVLGREGSFVIQHNGVFEDGTAKSTWVVVPSSGTGDLQGLQGKGRFVAEHGGQGAVTFDVDLN